MPSANRIAKETRVEELKKDVASVQGAVVTENTRITAEEILELRSALRKSGARYRVIKNSLALRGVVGTPIEPLKDSFVGPTALATSERDPVAMARVLRDFALAHPGKLLILAGVLEGKLLSAAEVRVLADVPSREVLLSRLVGSLQSPYGGLVVSLAGILRKLVYALDAIRREKEKQGA